MGFKFTDDVDNHLQNIAQNPYTFAKCYRNVRDKLLKEFPYFILHKISDWVSGIEVIQLFNAYQNPYWGYS